MVTFMKCSIISVIFGVSGNSGESTWPLYNRILFMQVLCLQDDATSLLQTTWYLLSNKDYVDVKVSHISHFIHHSKETSYSSRNVCHRCVFKNCLCINLELEFEKSPPLHPKNSGKLVKYLRGGRVTRAKHFSDYPLSQFLGS